MGLVRSRLFSQDVQSGITQIFHPSADGDSFVIETIYDAEPLIEANKAMMSEDSGNWKGDMHWVASLPFVVLMEWSKEGICTPSGVILDEKRMKRKLRDPEYAYLRVKGGNL